MSKQARILPRIDASGHDPRNHVGSRIHGDRRRSNWPASAPSRAAGDGSDVRSGGHAGNVDDGWGPRRRNQGEA
jgi:hypothetical protein